MITVTSLVLIYLYYVPIFWQSNNLLQFICLMFDGLILVYAAFNSTRMVTFLVTALLYIAFICISHLNELNANFRKLLNQILKRTLKTSVKQVYYFNHQIEVQFQDLHFQHCEIYQLFDELNQSIVSQTTLMAMVPNLCASIYFIAALLYRRSASGERAAMLLIILLQAIFVSSSGFLLSNLSNSLYNSHRLVYKTQLMIQSGQWKQQKAQILLKLKLANFYEFSNTYEKFNFTFGSLANYTQKSIFEVILN